MGMAGKVALCVMGWNPVSAATPDHPRFMGALLIYRIALVQGCIHATMRHGHLPF
jgi:hypothetical protein